MSVKEWSTNYPTSQDTGADGSDQQETLIDTQDETRVSQIHALRNKAHAMSLKVGDASDLPAGSHAAKITALEAASPGAPLWVWNGTDLSQFATKIEGSVIDTSVISVEDIPGTAVPAVRIRSTSGKSSSAEELENTVLLPLDIDSIPDDYALVADCWWPDSKERGPVLVVRSGTAGLPSLLNGYGIFWWENQDHPQLLKMYESGGNPVSNQIAILEAPMQPPTNGDAGPNGMGLAISCEGNVLLTTSVTARQLHVDAVKASDHQEGDACIGLIGLPSGSWSDRDCYFMNIRVWNLPTRIGVVD